MPVTSSNKGWQRKSVFLRELSNNMPENVENARFSYHDIIYVC
jgi:hypothetical protein